MRLAADANDLSKGDTEIQCAEEACFRVALDRGWSRTHNAWNGFHDRDLASVCHLSESNVDRADGFIKTGLKRSAVWPRAISLNFQNQLAVLNDVGGSSRDREAAAIENLVATDKVGGECVCLIGTA